MAEIVWIPAFAGMTKVKMGGRDLLASVWDWFRMAGLASTVWIPAFAGMTKVKMGEGFVGFGLGLVSGANLVGGGSALARDAPILAFPHEGGRDLSLAIRA